MKLILFYEKPGCSTNAKQKKSLQASGCMVIARNLLDHHMDADEILTYLDKKPCKEWFNTNAPAIKNGELNPKELSEQKALSLLLHDPILIRRPLISVDGHRMCGFDQEEIENILGISLGRKENEKCSSNTTCFSPVSPATSE